MLLYAEAHDSWSVRSAGHGGGSSGALAQQPAGGAGAEGLAGQLSGLALGGGGQVGEPQPLPPPRPSPGGTPLVFSGFVSHEQLLGAMAPRLRGSVLAGGGWVQRTSRLVMRGPGERCAAP